MTPLPGTGTWRCRATMARWFRVISPATNQRSAATLSRRLPLTEAFVFFQRKRGREVLRPRLFPTLLRFGARALLTAHVFSQQKMPYEHDGGVELEVLVLLLRVTVPFVV